MKKQHAVKEMVTVSILSVLCLICIALLFAVIWFYGVFGIVSIEGIVFTMKTPLDIDIGYYVASALKLVVLPTVGVAAAIVILLWILKKRKFRQMTAKHIRRILGTASGAFFLAAFITFAVCYDLVPYVLGTIRTSDFIEDNYVDPEEITITFPEKKKNIIHLYLESMESSYADEAIGGTLKENVIPELTGLALENVSFSNRKAGKIGGALQNDYTCFTIASMIAQTSGLPFKNFLDQKKFSHVSQIYPGITSMGEILEREGYRNYLITGSDGEYAGTKTYYEQHGNYSVYDYNYFYSNGMVGKCEEGYWGIKDYELYEVAKQKLTEISQQAEQSNAPFSVEMITIDTHGPEDGFYCEKCNKNQYEGKYKNIVSCADRQCYEFVEWLTKQSFYEDTVLIITGDHYTMSSEMIHEMKKSENTRTIYNAILNSSVAPGGYENEREFTMMDMCPTILAAAGATIEGERFGLGTNLFSGKETLWEEYGTEYVNQEMRKRSDFYTNMVTGDQ